MKFFFSVCLVSSFSFFSFFFLQKEASRKSCYLKKDTFSTTNLLKGGEYFNFAAIGDFGTGTQKQKQVAKGLSRVCSEKKCDFVVLLGDNFYETGVSSINDPQFKSKFLDIYKNIESSFFPILGNHDVKGSAEAQIDYTRMSKKWVFPDFFYSFGSSSANFISLNSNCGILQWFQFKLLSDSSKNKWSFVFAHHPIYSSGFHGDSNFLQQLILEAVFSEVDFYLSGHDHHLEHLTSESTNTDYIISGSAGKRTKAKGSESNANSLFSFFNYGFVFFQLTGREAQITYHDQDGAKIYSFKRYKS